MRPAIKDAKAHITSRGIALLLILLVAQGAVLAWAAPRFPSWNPRYLIPLLLLPVAIAVNAAALWHQRAHKRDVSCMTGMMIGMTIGMASGLLIGAIAGLMNGMFFGSLVGLIIGMAVGAYAGSCSGMMGKMEGLMAGLMGGTMGAMLTVMMIADHPIAFLVILTALIAIILIGMMLIVAQEHAGSECHIEPWPFSTVVVICVLTELLITAAMLLLPRGLF